MIVLVKEAVELFLGQYKASTAKAYRQSLKAMASWLGETKLVTEVEPAEMVRYFQDHVKTKGYAAATEQRHVKDMKTFWNYCVKLDLIVKSPALMLRPRKPPRRISRDKAMTDAELQALLDYLRYKTVPRDYALILFLADSGCRRGGAAGLRIQDVNFDKLVASVTEKGDVTRPVAFSETCAKAILHWLAYRSTHYRIRGVHLVNRDGELTTEENVYVFSLHGEPMKAENVSLLMRRACKAIGAPVRSPHSLRHRKGHQFADSRIAPSIAATALGHSDVTITLESYYPSDWETAEKSLRELMTSAPLPPRLVNFSEKR